MGTVTIAGMRDAEAAAMAAGWTEEGLLDLAGRRLGNALGVFFPKPGTAVGYLGKGHNAGDALVALRVLRDRFGWEIALRCACPIDGWAPLTRKKRQELGDAAVFEGLPAWRDLERPLLLLDGLLGIGATGALREPLLSMAAEMAWLRNHAGARIAAVDLPSGIHADSGKSAVGAVCADVTFMIGNAKSGLLSSRAVDFTGALALVAVEPLTVSGSRGDLEIIAPQVMDFAKAPRPFEFHKGRAGRVGILAGSDAYMGAAVLAAIGALRGGAGLVTLYVPLHLTSAISAKCPPEIMVRGISSPAEVDWRLYDAMAAGCGFGEPGGSKIEEFLTWLDSTGVPMVVDADALNWIARANRVGILNDRHVITPHPGEFRRLAPDLDGLDREAAARAFAGRTAATLVLKGSRTIVTRADYPVWCNSTGSPGMATGGQGDLLTGVIAARLAMGDAPPEAAALGVWLCGRAAELALREPGISEESLTPSDVSSFLGGACREWRSAQR